ncbi:MAG: hypothetical protein WDN44_02570 [Sphingomonas sp.]
MRRWPRSRNSGQSSQAIALARLLAEDGRATADRRASLWRPARRRRPVRRRRRGLRPGARPHARRRRLAAPSPFGVGARSCRALAHGAAELRRAVALAPDEPEALNALGYAQLEHGADLAGAQALLEHASRLKPDDAAIADSLARAYYRRGDVARALPLLERAGAIRSRRQPGQRASRRRLLAARPALRGALRLARGGDQPPTMPPPSASRAKLANGLTGAD